MERLGDEVRHSLRSAGVPDVGVLADVTRAWPSAVGPGIAVAAWPSRIGRDETLHVNTASAVWAFELARMEDEIRAKLTETLPAASVPPRLRFAVGPIPAAPAQAEPAPLEQPSVDPEILAEAGRLAASVEDDRLRDLVRRAAAASLAHPPTDRPF
jgi:Dna[CI] antecedent DciA-like protein